jgi:hypothetical protein
MGCASGAAAGTTKRRIYAMLGRPRVVPGVRKPRENSTLLLQVLLHRPHLVPVRSGVTLFVRDGLAHRLPRVEFSESPGLKFEGSAVKLVFATLIRAAERWQHIILTPLEFAQLQVLYQQRGLVPAQPISQVA